MCSRAIPIQVLGIIEAQEEEEEEEEEKKEGKEVILDLDKMDGKSSQHEGKPPVLRSRSGSRNRSSLIGDDSSIRNSRASLIITHEDGTVEQNPATVKTIRLSQENILNNKLTIEEYISPVESSDEERDETRDQISQEKRERIKLGRENTEHIDEDGSEEERRKLIKIIRAQSEKLYEPRTNNARLEREGRFRNEFSTSVDESIPAKSTTIEFNFPTSPNYENSTKFIIPGRREDTKPTRISVETLTEPGVHGSRPGVSVETQTSGLEENPRTSETCIKTADSKHISEASILVADLGKQLILTESKISEPLVYTPTYTSRTVPPKDRTVTTLSAEGGERQKKNDKEDFKDLKNKETISTEGFAADKLTYHHLKTQAVDEVEVFSEPDELEKSIISGSPVRVQTLEIRELIPSPDITDYVYTNVNQNLRETVIVEKNKPIAEKSSPLAEERRISNISEVRDPRLGSHPPQDTRDESQDEIISVTSVTSNEDDFRSASLGDTTWSPEPTDTHWSPPRANSTLGDWSPQPSDWSPNKMGDVLETSFEFVNIEDEVPDDKQDKERSKPSEGLVLKIPIHIETVQPTPRTPTPTQLLNSTPTIPSSTTPIQLLKRTPTTPIPSPVYPMFTKLSSSPPSTNRTQPDNNPSVYRNNNIITNNNKNIIDDNITIHTEKSRHTEPEKMAVRIVPIVLHTGKTIETTAGRDSSQTKEEENRTAEYSVNKEDENTIRVQMTRSIEGEEGIYFKTSQIKESNNNNNSNPPQQENNNMQHPQDAPENRTSSIFASKKPKADEGLNRTREGVTSPEPKKEEHGLTRNIPILLESGKLVSPSFKQLEDLQPPPWSVFHHKGSEVERRVPIQVEADVHTQPGPGDRDGFKNRPFIPSNPQTTSQTKAGIQPNPGPKVEPESKPNPGYKVDPEPGFNPESKNASDPKPSSDFFFSKRNPSAAVYSEKTEEIVTENRTRECREERMEKSSSREPTWKHQGGEESKKDLNLEKDEYTQHLDQIFDKYEEQRRSQDRESNFDEILTKSPFTDSLDSEDYPNVTHSSKTEFITSRSEYSTESIEQFSTVGPREKVLIIPGLRTKLQTSPSRPPPVPSAHTAPSRPPSASSAAPVASVRNIPIRKYSDSPVNDTTLPSAWTPKPRQSPLSSGTRSRSYDGRVRVDDTKPRWPTNHEETAKTDALDALKKVHLELEAARSRLSTQVNEMNSSIPVTNVPLVSRPYSSIDERNERSRSVESEKHIRKEVRNSRAVKLGRERSLQDIDKDIETIWRELQELDRLPLDENTSTKETTLKSGDRPPSAPPTLSQQNLVTPPWRSRNRTASGNNTSDSTLYKTKSTIRDGSERSAPGTAKTQRTTSPSSRTIWDPVFTRSSGDYGPRYPATPVPTFSSSWDPKPNYFPTQPNHFSFLPKPETKPGNITPTYCSGSPRGRTTSTRSIPIVQGAQPRGGFGEAASRLKSEFLSEPRSGLSKPDMVRTVPIVQENRTEKKYEDGVKEGYPPSSMEEEKRSPDVTGRSSQPCSTSKQETRSGKGITGLKSCLKSGASSPSTPSSSTPLCTNTQGSTKTIESYKQNVFFKSTGVRSSGKDNDHDYDWMEFKKNEGSNTGKEEKTVKSAGSVVPTPNSRISGERSRVDIQQPKEEKVEKVGGDMRNEKGGTNPFECEDCRYKDAGDKIQCSACDAGTQTERVKKSNCRVM